MAAHTGKSSRHARLRWLPGLVIALVAGAAATACSDPVDDCSPPIPPGARYRVTVGAETPTSDACHLVRMDIIKTFEVTAGKQPAELGRQACFTTPALDAPPQQSIVLDSCKGAQTEQLGAFCEMRYPASCEGLIWFYFDSPDPAVPVNWSAPIIDVIYKIRDQTTGCIPGNQLADCTDEYFARLERVQ